MLTISKEFHFSAAHRLEGLQEGHPCGRMHGHNYIIRVFLIGEVNKVGFIQDYNDLAPIKEYVDNILDHKLLNDVFPTINPTVENMTPVIFNFIKQVLGFEKLHAIEMSETPKTNCRYEPK
ncbi:MAG: 6-carboxytetrahydropterin synthase [Clostridia bacterium]|nr:6-carboxytetrahydropterin synthase [Clostridia bacterium]MDD3970482.1 6-carboxytetrahydropterin synthase [Clostridia bacterium]